MPCLGRIDETLKEEGKEKSKIKRRGNSYFGLQSPQREREHLVEKVQRKKSEVQNREAGRRS